MSERVRQAIERFEKEQSKPRKKKDSWSKINRGGKRVAIRKPYHDEYLKELREARHEYI